MSRPRPVPAVAVVLAALLLQRSVLAGLPWPVAAAPDLVLLAVVALALRGGSEVGAVAGFGAGIALDLLPPADHAVGRWALAFTVLGFLTGLVAGRVGRSLLVPIAVLTVASAASPLLFATTGAALGSGVPWSRVAAVCLGAGLYAVLLSPLLVWSLRSRDAPAPVLAGRP